MDASETFLASCRSLIDRVNHSPQKKNITVRWVTCKRSRIHRLPDLAALSIALPLNLRYGDPFQGLGTDDNRSGGGLCFGDLFQTSGEENWLTDQRVSLELQLAI